MLMQYSRAPLEISFTEWATLYKYIIIIIDEDCCSEHS